MRAPNRLSGNSPIIPWLNSLRDFAVAIVPRPGIGHKTKYTSNGVMFEIEPSGLGLKIARYRFKSMGTDHLVCRTWDGTTDGASDIFIAKSPKLRFSITSETIDVLTITYSSYNIGSQTRVATGTISENQAIVPRFLVNDIIYAVSASTGVTVSSSPVSLIDLNLDARAWSAF